MNEKKPYRLSFYESGYIKPEEFSERRDWAEGCILISELYRKGFFDAIEKIDVDKIISQHREVSP